MIDTKTGAHPRVLSGKGVPPGLGFLKTEGGQQR